MVTLSVGVLAALINVITLLIVSFTDRALEFIVRNFSVIRLRLLGRAPIVHDSDIWLPNLPRSLLKYLRYPFILLTLICSLLLVTSELITELGVDVRQDCGPHRSFGPVISPGDTSGQVTDVELGASSFFLQGVGFIDGKLTNVRAGMPRKLSNVTCISCVNVSNVPVVSNCSVRRVREVNRGDMRIRISRNLTTAFGTVTEGFHDLKTNVSYNGVGDVTKNNDACATFLFVDSGDGDDDNDGDNRRGGRMMGTPTAAHLPPHQVRQQQQQQRQRDPTNTTTLSVTYLEYANQDHCESLLKKSKRALSKNSSLNPVFSTTEPTLDTVYISSILCVFPSFSSSSIKLLTSGSLAKILRGYRTMQLENTIHPALLAKSNHRFAQLSEDDVYRAVLAMKIIDDGNDTGELFEYVQCGMYHMKFIGPFVVTLGVIAILGIVSSCLLKQVGDVHIPYSSNSWYAEVPSIPVVQQRRRQQQRQLQRQRRQQQRQQSDLWWCEGEGEGNGGGGVPSQNFNSSSNNSISSRYANNNNPNNNNNTNNNPNFSSNDTHVNSITHHDSNRRHHHHRHLEHRHESDISPSSHTLTRPPSLATTTTTTAPQTTTHPNTSLFSFSWNALRFASNTHEHSLPPPATTTTRPPPQRRRRSYLSTIRDELVLVSDGSTETIYIERHSDTASVHPVTANATANAAMMFTRVGAGVDVDDDDHPPPPPPRSRSRSPRFVRNNNHDTLSNCDFRDDSHRIQSQQQQQNSERYRGDDRWYSNNNNREFDRRSTGRIDMAHTRGNQQQFNYNNDDHHRYWQQYDEYYDDDDDDDDAPPPPPTTSPSAALPAGDAHHSSF